MSRAETLRDRRRRRAVQLVAASAAALFASLIVVGVDARMRGPSPDLGVFAPGFALQARDAARIQVRDRHGVLTFQRTQQGWRLRERGDFPAAQSRVDAILDGLKTMQKTMVLTADPQRWDLLRLGDPAAGGEGVAVIVSNARGVEVMAAIVGYGPNGTVFARAPSGGSAFAVEGAPEALNTTSAWLDLSLAQLQRTDVRSVDVTPAAGAGYRLARMSAASAFAFAPPHDTLAVVAPIGVSATAHAFDGLAPSDVAAFSALSQARPRGTVRIEAFSGVAMTAEVLEDAAAAQWVRLLSVTVQESTPPSTPPDAAAVDAIAARAAGWAFRISDLEARTLLTPLEDLVRLPRRVRSPPEPIAQ